MTAPAQYAGELNGHLTQLTMKARDEAVANRPPSDALRLDQNEAEIITEAERFAAEAHRAYASVLAQSSRVAHELQQQTPVLDSRIQQVLSETAVRSEADAELSGASAELVSLAESRMQAHTDLKYFRERHGIKIEATYPESHVWHFAIILLFAFIEAFANSFFYENSQGLLGGFVVAAGVSVVNLASALGLGMLFRYRNLKDPEKRYAGWFCLLAFAVITLYCNALFATFRAEYQTLKDPSDTAALRHAFRVAVSQARHFFTGDTNLGDFLSFILFALGIILSCLAFYKGYTFDDVYPGHGKLHRKYRQARAEEERAIERVRDKLKSFLQSKREALQSLTREIARTINESGVRAAQLQQARAHFRTQQDLIQQDCNLALQTYRNANVAIRPTPAPAYFTEYPEIRRHIDDAAVADILGILAAARDNAEKLRDRYQAPLNSALNNLQSEIASILDVVFSDFLRKVERNAADRLDRLTGTVQRASHQTAVHV